MKKICLFIVLLSIKVSSCEKYDTMLYALQWLPLYEDEPIEGIEYGQKAFYKRKCTFVNCYVTTGKSVFFTRNITKFDAILFNVVNLQIPKIIPMPREASQKYIFYAKDPAATNTIPKKFDDFFNYTWTYKLDSDISIPFIVVSNKFGDVIGPQTNINWMNIMLMKPTKSNIIIELETKKFAVAWIMTNCRANNRRISYVEVLRESLRSHAMIVDIYGCGYLEYPENYTDFGCCALIADYYFYLAFEDSFCEDYVTEKVLHAIDHYAIPVVYGGANCTRYHQNYIFILKIFY